jgi:DNA polymerase
VNLDQLNAKIAHCRKCSLHKGRIQAVPGGGNPHADIMFIGEAPGRSEDEKGEPFVGAAGKFLNELLESIGLKREDIYIANTIKCRPPDNRDPRPEEIKTCLPYLKQQILIIQPKVIATLGRFSMNLFFPELKISQVHGKPQIKNNLCIVPLYHPAAALYNGGQRDSHLRDFQVLKQLMEKMKK